MYEKFNRSCEWTTKVKVYIKFPLVPIYPVLTTPMTT